MDDHLKIVLLLTSGVAVLLLSSIYSSLSTEIGEHNQLLPLWGIIKPEWFLLFSNTRISVSWYLSDNLHWKGIYIQNNFKSFEFQKTVVVSLLSQKGVIWSSCSSIIFQISPVDLAPLPWQLFFLQQMNPQILVTFIFIIFVLFFNGIQVWSFLSMWDAIGAKWTPATAQCSLLGCCEWESQLWWGQGARMWE